MAGVKYRQLKNRYNSYLSCDIYIIAAIANHFAVVYKFIITAAKNIL